MPRIYKPANIFEARIVGMRNLWEPSWEYQGRRTEKPSYLATFAIEKTAAHWSQEPRLTEFTQSCMALHQSALSHLQLGQIDWPLKDGDYVDPSRPGPIAEWRKGHWIMTASSNSPIRVTILRNGVPVQLEAPMGVKPGDYVGVGLSLAVKANDPKGVKCYLNNVMFMRPGEEIQIGTSASPTEMMEKAKAQGLNVTGFSNDSGAPQGFNFPAPAQPPAAAPQQAGFGGFNGGFNPSGGFPPR